MDIAATLFFGDAWGMHGDVGAGWWIVMMLIMVAFLGAILIGGAYLIRGRGERAESPMEILDRRLAAGEISSDEYRERRAVLTGDAGPDGGEPHVPAGPTAR